MTCSASSRPAGTSPLLLTWADGSRGLPNAARQPIFLGTERRPSGARVRSMSVEPPILKEASGPGAELVKNTIGGTVTVDVLEPDGVERSIGKMRRIVDRRGG